MTCFSSPPGCTEQQRMYLGESCKHFLGFEQPTVVQNLRYPPLKSLPSGYPGDSTIHRLNNRSKVHIARDFFCNLKLAWIQSLTPSVSDSKPCLKFRLISTKKIRNYAIRHFHIDRSAPCLPPQILHNNYFQVSWVLLPWVPDVFLACGGNFRCRPSASLLHSRF